VAAGLHPAGVPFSALTWEGKPVAEWVSAATRQCPVCHASTPQGDFCGYCGVSLRVQPTFLRKLLRPRVYVAAPRQPVELPLITSTLFPRLAQPYRRPFQHGLILIALGLVVFSLLRLLVPLIVMTTLGLPLLFLLYLWHVSELAARHKRSRTSVLTDLARDSGARDPELLARQLAVLVEGATTLAMIDGGISHVDAAESAATALLRSQASVQTTG